MRNALVFAALLSFVVIPVGLSIPWSKLAGDGPRPAAKSDGGVDLDFTAMNDALRIARFTELMRCPQVSTGKTVRVMGRAIYTVDILGRRHCRIVVPDPMGCCGIGVVEYFPMSTNSLPQKGSMFVLTGTVALPPEGDIDSDFVFTGVTTRPWQPSGD